MSRMYGENAQRYSERQLGQAGKKEVNEKFRNSIRSEIPVAPACTCNFLPYPHLSMSFPEWMKRRHDADWRPLY